VLTSTALSRHVELDGPVVGSAAGGNIVHRPDDAHAGDQRNRRETCDDSYARAAGVSAARESNRV